MGLTEKVVVTEVILLLFWCSPLTSNNLTKEQIQETTDLLALAGADMRNVHIDLGVMVMGLSGTGKSTLVHLLSRDNSELIVKNHMKRLVFDDGGKAIGHSVSQSKTFMPELTVDEETGVTFVDCPGFRDTRSTSKEIAASYAIIKVMEQIKYLKIIYTISYRDLFNRESYKNSFCTMGKFFLDFESIKNSFVLVFTKVRGSGVDKNYKFIQFIEEAELIENIKPFLYSAIIEISNKTENVPFCKGENEIVENRVAHILQYILNEKDVIRVFREPIEIGPVSKMPIYQEERFRLRGNLDGLVFFTPKPSMFSLTLSAEANMHIQASIKITTAEIHPQLKSFFVIFSEHYQSLRYNEPYLLDFASNVTKTLQNFEQCNNNETRVMEKLQCLVENLDVISPNAQRTIENIKLDVEKIVSLNKLIGVFDLTVAVETVGAIITQIKFFSSWYEMWISIHEAYHNYNTFKLLSNQLSCVRNVSIDKLPLLFKCIENIANVDEIKYSKILSKALYHERYLHTFMISDANQIMNHNGRTPDSKCEDGQNIEINGTIIFTSNFFSYLSECEGKQINESIASISIFATDVIFIDEDIDLRGKYVVLNMLAPKWEVVGNRTIDMSGLDGVPHESSKAVSGGRPHGAHGLPGRPGQTAGSFFGYGEEFVNEQNLKILANGGTGGPGQDGGYGDLGIIPAPPAEPSDVQGKPDFNDFVNDFAKSNGYVLVGSDRYDRTYLPYLVLYIYESRHYVATFENRQGSLPGAPGGDGGIGGVGGRNGVIMINGTLNISVSAISGNSGTPGQGGLGGTEGAEGHYRRLWCHWSDHMFFFVYSRTGINSCHSKNFVSQYFPAAKSGSKGKNLEGLLYPETALTISQQEIIKEFKSKLQDSTLLSPTFRKTELFLSIE